MPRIWRPTDDIEGVYTRARESTLTLIPLLSRFQSSRTTDPPPLDSWIGAPPDAITPADEEDLAPIGGVDEEEGKSLEEEMRVLSEAKRQDLTTRFKKTADGVYVEAKRSAIGGVAQVPLYFYGLLLALGWNEIVAGMSIAPFTLHPHPPSIHHPQPFVLTTPVLRNPIYFLFLILLAIAAYITYTLNLWGPLLKMTNAASQQALEIGKERLREFLEQTDTGRQAMALSGVKDEGGADIGMSTLDGRGKKIKEEDEDEDEI